MEGKASTSADVSAIVAAVASNFRCFGGAEKKSNAFNPLVEALSPGPVTFAMGVDVADVVRFVLAADPRDAVIRELRDGLLGAIVALDHIAGLKKLATVKVNAKDGAKLGRALLARLGLGVTPTKLVTLRKEDCAPLLVPDDRVSDFAQAGWFPEEVMDDSDALGEEA